MTFGPVVAGQFYPSDENALKVEIEGCLAGADILPDPDKPLLGLISPHAGYAFSGPVAAYAYKAIPPDSFDIAVVIGVAHHAPGTGSVLRANRYRTPLGEVEIDLKKTAQLMSREHFINDDRNLFTQEHSIELQLPFLQSIAKGFRLVLISMRSSSDDHCLKLAEALHKTFEKDRALFIASTDLSHFHDYAKARKTDRETLRIIEKSDIAGLAKSARNGRCELCGLGPVITLMHLHRLRKGGDVKILKYLNSGDTSGDRDRVVGYAAVAFLGRTAEPH